MNPRSRFIQSSVLFTDAAQTSGWRAYIMKNNRTRDGLVCGIWAGADTARPASMLSAPAFIYHFGWEVSFAWVSQPFNGTFITTDCSQSVARITNSTSPNNPQMESWWEWLEFSFVFKSTPPYFQSSSQGEKNVKFFEGRSMVEENNRRIWMFWCLPAVPD